MISQASKTALLLRPGPADFPYTTLGRLDSSCQSKPTGGGSRGLMDRASDLWPEVVGSNLSSGRNCPQLRWDPWARHRTLKSSRYPSLPQVTLATCSRSYQIQGIDVCLQDNNWHCTNMPKLANTNLYALQKLAFCKWTTPCGAIPNRYQITLTAQLVEWPPDLNLNSWVFTRFQKNN